MSAQLLETVRSAYAFIDQLNISVTGLVVAAVLLSLAFLFALREAASWFFKIDDLKRDVRRLRDVVVEMEAEVRALQSFSVTPSTPAASVETAPLAVVNAAVANENAKASKPAFSITH